MTDLAIPQAQSVQLTAAQQQQQRISKTDLPMLFVVVIWAFNFSIVKVALPQIPPLAFTSLRFAFACLPLMLVLKWREGSYAFPPGSFWALVGLGVIGNTIYQLLFISGLAITTAANSALLLASTPVIVAISGALLGIERLTRPIITGIVCAFIGITLVVAARGATLSLQTLKGDLLVGAGVVCWTIYIHGVRVFSSKSDISPLRMTALTTLTGTPGLVLAGIPEMLELSWASVSFIDWMALLYSSIFAVVIAYLIWNASVQNVGGSRTAVYACVTPLIAALVAWPMLGEQPVPLQAVGALLIIGGVLLTRRPSTKEQKLNEA